MRKELGEMGRTAVVHDAHPLWLEAVQGVLDSIGVAVVGSAVDTETALALVDQHGPDLLITDLEATAGGMSAHTLIELARQRSTALRVIVIAASQETADIDAAFASGALAYVLKSAHPADVAATIRQAFDHSVFLAASHPNGRTEAPRPAPTADAEGLEAGLTRREREILALVSEGHSNRELAQMMWVTEQTVKFHLSNIYRKLDVSNRTEASRWAHKHALAVVPELRTA
jgi:DNA-binding NarL/FixJ family response regulator